jgi:hypothetical protein
MWVVYGYEDGGWIAGIFSTEKVAQKFLEDTGLEDTCRLLEGDVNPTVDDWFSDDEEQYEPTCQCPKHGCLEAVGPCILNQDGSCADHTSSCLYEED